MSDQTDEKDRGNDEQTTGVTAEKEGVPAKRDGVTAEQEGGTAEDESGTVEVEGGTTEDENDTAEDEGDTAEDERMLFGEKREETTLFVGSSLGVTRIDVAAAQVGQFSLVERGTVRCLATDGGVLVVASEDGVLVTAGDGFVNLGFESATAVGIDDSWVYAADDSRLRRLNRQTVEMDGSEMTGDWETIDEVTEPRRFDGTLLATATGVVRVGESAEPLGLTDVQDLSATGPLAATGDGLYRYDGSEWTQLLAGDASAVIEAGPQAFAVVDGRLFERDGERWEERSVPGESPPAELAYGKTLAVITEDGSVHVAADPERTHDGHGGWRSQALGLRDIAGFVALTA